MRLVTEDGGVRCETIMDFVVPTLDEARAYIRDGGAVNGVELLREAGLSLAAARRESRKLEKERGDDEPIIHIDYDGPSS